mgnify:CR=1 FL=1
MKMKIKKDKLSRVRNNNRAVKIYRPVFSILMLYSSICLPRNIAAALQSIDWFSETC